MPLQMFLIANRRGRGIHLKCRSRLPLAITEQLRFEGSEESKAAHFVEPGILDQQALRWVRELDYASAQLLDKFLSTDS